MTWPVTVQMVRGWIGDTETGDDPALALAVDAVNAYVPSIPALAAFMEFDEPDTFTPPDDVQLGAVMLASRLHARRGALLGTVSGYQDFAGMVMRQDPDIARLLRLGSSSPGFVFGAPTPAVAAS